MADIANLVEELSKLTVLEHCVVSRRQLSSARVNAEGCRDVPVAQVEPEGRLVDIPGE